MRRGWFPSRNFGGTELNTEQLCPPRQHASQESQTVVLPLDRSPKFYNFSVSLTTTYVYVHTLTYERLPCGGRVKRLVKDIVVSILQHHCWT